jgi:hypothetical protein
MIDEEMEETTESESAHKERDWEGEAKGMGWNPDYDGDDGVDAREYVLRKPLFDELRKVRKKARELDNALVMQRQVQERLIEAQKRNHEKEIAELQAAKMQAVQDSDVQKVTDIEGKIKDLEGQTPDIPQQAQPDPAFTKWLDDNRWYEDDDDMQLYADAMANKIQQGNKNLSPHQVLNEVTTSVMKTFPHKFKNPNREKAQSVESNSPSRSSKKEDDTTLSPEQKRIARTQWNAGFFGAPTSKGGKVSFKEGLKAYADELRKAGMIDEE